MNLLTTSNNRRSLNSGLGKLAGQLSLKATNMTRILSVFNLLKRVGLVFLLLGANVLVQAQPPSIAWQTDLYTDLECKGLAITAMPDSEFVVAGWIESPTSSSQNLMLARISDRGFLELVRFYGEGFHGSLTDVISGSSRTVTAVGQSSQSNGNSRVIVVLHTNANGEPIWERRYGENGDFVAEGVCSTGNDGYFVAGTMRPTGSNQYNGFISLLDIQGDSVTSFIQSGENPTGYEDIALIDDGGAIAVGSKSFGGSQSEDILITKVDSQLEEVWSVTYGGNGIDRAEALEVLPNGNTIICGQTAASDASALAAFAMLCNQDGDSITALTFGGDAAPWSANSVDVRGDTVLIAGATGSSSSAGTDGFLYALSFDLEVLWMSYSDGESGDAFNGVAIGSNGTIQTVGSTESFSTTDTDLYYAGFDSLGYLVSQGNYGASYLRRSNASAIVPGNGIVVGTAIYGGVTNSRNINSLTALDSSGVAQWQVFLDAGFFDNALFLTSNSNGTCYLTGSRALGLASPSDYLIQAVSLEGELLWENSFGDGSDEWIGPAAVLPDGRIMVVLGSGDESESQARLGIFSAEGDYLNEIQATELPGAVVGDIDASGEHVVILGSFNGNGGRSIFISMYDSSYQHTWTRTRERLGTGYSAEIHIRGNEIVATSNRSGTPPNLLFQIDRLNSQGDSISFHSFERGMFQTESSDLTYEGGLITPALGEGSDDSVERLSVNGDIVWTVYPEVNPGGVRYLDDRSIRIVGSPPDSELDIMRVVATNPEELLSYSSDRPPLQLPHSKLYPNPAVDRLTLNVFSPSHEVGLILYNVLGQQVYKADYAGRMVFIEAIDLPALASGAYFARVSNGPIVETHRIQVNR